MQLLILDNSKSTFFLFPLKKFLQLDFFLSLTLE